MSKTDEEIIVTMTDCVKAGFCASGVRRWLRGHDLDMRVFLKEGFPLPVIAELNDAHGNRAIEIAKERVNGRRRR